MNILLHVRSLDAGGAERQVTELAGGLATRGHAATVAVFYGAGVLEEYLTASEVDLVGLGKAGRWDVVGPVRRLVAEVHERDIDAVYTFMDGPNVLGALSKRWLDPAALVWGIRASDMQLERYGPMAQMMFRLERALSSVPDSIVVNSEAGREHRIEHGFASDHMTVIPNGIDTERFSPDPKAGERVREELSLPADSSVVTRVGRFGPMKDHRTLLKAFARVAANDETVHLLCVGRGTDDQLRSFDAWVEELDLVDRVLRPGERHDMPAVYNASDLVVSSSAFGEGFPNVIGEAMACGTPCVSTNVGDAATILDGLWPVVPPEDPTTLAQAIDEVLAMEDEERGKRALEARSHVESEYGLNRLIDRTERVLREALTRKTG